MSTPVISLHAGATLFMTGLVWFVQVVHYPLFERVGRDGFPDYERRHQQRTTWVVAPGMLIETAAALILLYQSLGTDSLRLCAIGVALLAVIWISTALLQVPCHRRLNEQFDQRVIRKLVRGNWVRTIAWSLRSVVALTLLAGPAR